MTQPQSTKTILIWMLSFAMCATLNLHARIDNYRKEKILKKHAHNVQETCTTSACRDIESCLHLLIKEINHDFPTDEVDPLDNIEQDQTTLTKIKEDATYWFWPSHPDDDQTLQQTKKCLVHVEEKKELLQHHKAYIQGLKITKFYAAMPTNDESFATWMNQNFTNANHYEAIACRHHIQKALATIDQFSAEDKAQYPKLYDQLVAIKAKINTIYPKLEKMYHVAYEKQQEETTAREYRQLREQQIQAQNRAAQAQELQAQADREKTKTMRELMSTLLAIPFSMHIEQGANSIQRTKSIIENLQHKLNRDNTEEQQLKRKLAMLEIVMKQNLEHAKLQEKKAELARNINAMQENILRLQRKQLALQADIARMTPPTQAEINRYNSEVAALKKELDKQYELLRALQGQDIPTATAYPVDNSPCPQAHAEYAPAGPSAPSVEDHERQPAYNPDYRANRT